MTSTETTRTVRVTIAVTVDGDTKLFAADATTDNDPHRVAAGLLSGLDRDADCWLAKTGGEARRGF